MKRLFLKLCSLVMIMSVSLSIISCGKNKGNKRDAEIIAEDSPWFESEVVTIDLGINTGTPISSYSVKLVGSDEKNIVVFVDGEYASGADDTNCADEFLGFLRF